MVMKEEYTVSGSELKDRVKQLLKEGNVFRLVIRKSNGKILLNVPLSTGATVGGLALMFAPILAMGGAVAGYAAKFKIEIIRKPDKS